MHLQKHEVAWFFISWLLITFVQHYGVPIHITRHTRLEQQILISWTEANFRDTRSSQGKHLE